MNICEQQKNMGGLAAWICLVIVVLVGLTIQIFYFSPIHPIILEPVPPQFSSLVSPFTINNHLHSVIKLGDGLLKDPEDVSIDKHGTIYACSRDGWVLRFYTNGSWDHWKNLHSSSTLGSTISSDGSLIVCDAEKVQKTKKTQYRPYLYTIYTLQFRFLYIHIWFYVQGLLKVSEDGVSVLVSQVNGSKLK